MLNTNTVCILPQCFLIKMIKCLVLMNNKEIIFENFTSKETEVNPEIVWGSEQRVTEIVGLGSGRGFELKGINLPKDWDQSIENLRRINLDNFKKYSAEICNKWNFSLEQVVFDPNKVLKEVKIKNTKNNIESRIFLPDYGVDAKNGIYLSENLNTIEPVMIFQELMADYLDFGWGDEFDYGYVAYNEKSSHGGNFGPIDLEIPSQFFNSGKNLTHEGFQKDFAIEASNITGRFGINLKEIKFNDRDLLTVVGVTGNRTCYFLENGGRGTNKFESHNVDTPYQAAALHTIVASYVNFLLGKG